MTVFFLTLSDHKVINSYSIVLDSQSTDSALFLKSFEAVYHKVEAGCSVADFSSGVIPSFSSVFIHYTKYPQNDTFFFCLLVTRKWPYANPKSNLMSVSGPLEKIYKHLGTCFLINFQCGTDRSGASKCLKKNSERVPVTTHSQSPPRVRVRLLGAR